MHPSTLVIVMHGAAWITPKQGLESQVMNIKKPCKQTMHEHICLSLVPGYAHSMQKHCCTILIHYMGN
jgi:hypothetical protein